MKSSILFALLIAVFVAGGKAQNSACLTAGSTLQTACMQFQNATAQNANLSGEPEGVSLPQSHPGICLALQYTFRLTLPLQDPGQGEWGGTPAIEGGEQILVPQAVLVQFLAQTTATCRRQRCCADSSHQEQPRETLSCLLQCRCCIQHTGKFLHVTPHARRISMLCGTCIVLRWDPLSAPFAK